MSPRMSAGERRETAVRAAMIEFARGGFEGTSTEAIAKRVGVSQPYLFRLFGSKRELFLICVERCFETFQGTMCEAADGRTGQEAIQAMGQAYRTLLGGDPTILQLQLQIQAVALHDKEVRGIGRARWGELWRTIAELSGEEPAEVTRFISVGMLLNVLTAFGVPYEPGDQLAQSLTDWATRA